MLFNILPVHISTANLQILVGINKDKLKKKIKGTKQGKGIRTPMKLVSLDIDIAWEDFTQVAIMITQVIRDSLFDNM